MTEIIPIDPEAGSTERMEAPDEYLPGQWYWVKDTEYRNNKRVPIEWLGCIMRLGSNYIKIESVEIDGSRHTARIHFDKAHKELRFEPDADRIISETVAGRKNHLNKLLGHVREVTTALGVVPTGTSLENLTSAVDNALATISTQVDTSAYKTALVEAKDVTLPDLFKQIKRTTKEMAGWMAAPILPMMAEMIPMKETISGIEDRIGTLGLYAGLTEEAVKVRDGDPAKTAEPLRVMQRRLYMDEESLANLKNGGIDIETVDVFDDWLSDAENFERIMPFPRCLVAFRVRRNDKDREDGGNFLSLWANAQMREADKLTFIYIRNGEQLWRVTADFEFDEKIIPDRTEFDPTQPQMVKMWGSRVDKIIPKSLYDVWVEDNKKTARQYKEWKAANPEKGWIHNPYGTLGGPKTEPHDFGDYVPFSYSSVYFDEAQDFIASEIKRYNRVAVIIQGLFDRSLVLHPHHPVQVWDAASFAKSIELVYDSMTLSHGDAPDFEAYRAELNASISPDSVVTGQEEFWLLRNAVRENERQEKDWRNRDRQRSNWTRYREDGDPGPGMVAIPTEWQPRAKKAVFKWEAETNRWGEARGSTKPRSVSVPVTALFNVSAYKPGDYKRFLGDSRTRQDYLKWAPLLLAAEDYHAGRLKLREGKTPLHRNYGRW